MDGGTLVAQVLKQQEVHTLFTLCGGHISPILVACKKAGIRVIDTRHEASAVFAADASARISGITGVAAVTAGPGITNSITAIRNALMAQSPVVLLGGAAPTLLKGRGALQDIDQVSLMRPNVKWLTAVRQRKEIQPSLTKAFRIATEGTPGPVFVELLLDLLFDETLVRSWYMKAASGASVGAKVTSWYIKRHVEKMFAGRTDLPVSTPAVHIPTHHRQDLTRLQAKLDHCQRPLMVVGSGAMMQPQLAEKMSAALSAARIPLYLSGMARGLMGPDHPLQYRHHRKEALRDADLVILAGVPADFRLDYGRHISRKALLVGLNRSRQDLIRNRKPDLALHCDPMQFLIDFASHFKPKHKWEKWGETLRQRDEAREADIMKQAMSDEEGINPIRLFVELRKRMSPDAMVIADGGDFVATASYILRPPRPLSWLDPGAFGTLGIGGGFALAAKTHQPSAETYLIYGDGSSAYSILEIDTMMRHGLPTIIIIGNDASWSQIARDQIEILQDDVGTTLRYSDYEKIAESFGAKGRRVSNIEHFLEALEEAKASIRNGVTFVINAVLAKSDFRKGSLSM
ncbi:MAG: thiamine pyrophosphate-binding protein [Bacteroidetes bacterium]|nr:thiamine pyrophosphate-binding protein [Bacteroidota bacterium]